MEYISQRGKTVPARHVKPSDCSKCKYECNSKIDDRERRNILTRFGL